ncbi:hypothetical protein L9F63_004153 [Diploptera punctata]|uniref:BAG domain-containing protein n=1 Tax=Diploptera punctata TaxID=6984 RepID=A0AAD8E7K4_DIPPU|nr:hypothetical protein L9F63_004153 [Diploptera punctata]
MSFSYRDKPRLSERLRGKSGDEILNELEEQFDQDRKMFFETNPNWRSTPMTGPFSRTGFPFDDDMISRGRQDIRSHLDDLAQRHPEFADHLRCPPWGGEVGNVHTFGRKRRGSGTGSVDGDVQSQASAAGSSNTESPVNQEPEDRGRGRPGNLNQHGLRNTVDLGQQQHQESEDKQTRGQRSMSAPPDNRSQQQPQRFVSRLEINPVNPADPTSGGGPSTVTTDNHGKPPVAPKQMHQQQTSKQQQSGNVRHIPIFVEGRDEPLLPKVGPETVEQVFPQPTTDHMQQTFSRPGFSSPHQFYPQQQPAQSSRGFQQHHMAPPSPKQQQQGKPSPPPQQQTKAASPPPPKQPQAPPANDPISRVQVVAKDVAELQAQVEKYTGTSRKDKDYIYLDEMLTRNLLKLDDIDTEGKDNVRQARKEVIKTIQKCISILETKVPNPEEEKLPQSLEESKTEEPMQTESETATEENKNNISEGTMEVTVPVDDKQPPPENTMEVAASVDDKQPAESTMEIAAPAEDKQLPTEAEVESKPDSTKEETAQLPMEVQESKQTETAVTDAKDSAVTEETKDNGQSEVENPAVSEKKSS